MTEIGAPCNGIFRVWNSKRMLTFPDITEWDIKDYSDFIKVCEDGGKPPMRFTGLLDKRGTRIFEDDLCQSSISRSCPYGIVRIVWNEETAGFVAVDPKNLISVTQNFVKEEAIGWLVIGNALENPNLRSVNDKELF